MSHDPRPDGRIVELANFGTRFEADAAMSLLESNGIQATAKYGDAGGWMPHVALLDGFRVLVFDDDLDRARELLRAEETLTSEPEPGPN
jgi:putative signal transducing protein